jgi:uncharacterized protein YbjT (DUF2867 family)
MHIILGGTGHVGSALSLALIAKGEPVTVVTHTPAKADDWRRKDAEVAVVDVRDTEALREVFRRGKRLFLLNPNADPSTDTDLEERKNLKSILAAVEGSGLEKIVAESTYGAQPVDRAGDLGILYEMEQGLKAQPISATIQRAAYYMSNWDASLETAKKDGVIQSFFPADLTLPMVDPRDLGQAAARWMTEPVESTGLHYVEGPERYTPADVAAAFSAALQKPVELEVIPRESGSRHLGQWDFPRRGQIPTRR